MIEDDQEARACQLLAAMEGMIDLLDGRAPGLSVQAEHVAALMRLIHADAVLVVPNGIPKGFHFSGANNDRE